MASRSVDILVPTYQGYINCTFDALLLFEACLTGVLSHMPRRPLDRERPELIQSGNVFIFEEESSGIKRWTDGIVWSPSRIFGNFLIYRELDAPFPPGKKKRAFKKSKPSTGRNSRPWTSPDTVARLPALGTPAPFEKQEVLMKSLIGSLVDSYNFKSGGLIKKTISAEVKGVTHHLVSYYSVDDIVKNRFSRPSEDTFFQNVIPRKELLKQNFRASLEEISITGGLPFHRGLFITPQLQLEDSAMMRANDPGYFAACGPELAAESVLPYAHRRAEYDIALPDYLGNGACSQWIQWPLQEHYQNQLLSTPEPIVTHQQTQQMQWTYPLTPESPSTAFSGPEVRAQLSLSNNYFEQDCNDSQ